MHVVWKRVSDPPDIAKGLIKCAIAYFLGSLATFIPFISDLYGKNDGKHVVATVAVYFHPSRSAGGMAEATFFAFVALMFSSSVSIGSMMTAVFFSELDMPTLGHLTVLFVWCGGAVFAIAYAKQRLQNSTFSTACSLMSMVIFVMLTKEGAVQLSTFRLDKIMQYSAIVFTGVLCSLVVSLSVWPVEGRKKLRHDMIVTTDSFAEMLTMITQSFLLSSDMDVSHPSFRVAMTKHRASFASLAKNLKEAKWEYYIAGKEDEYHLEEKVVKVMQRIGQHISGLQSSATLQSTVLKQARDRWRREAGENNDWCGEEHDPPTKLASVFVNHLGPPLKSLAYTCKATLRELPYGPPPRYNATINPQLIDSLRQAVTLYSGAREKTLKHLYANHMKDFQDQHFSPSIETEEVAASMDYFSYSLEEFARGLLVYLDALRELETYRIKACFRTWRWARFWEPRARDIKAPPRDEETGPTPVPGVRTRRDEPVARREGESWGYRIWKTFEWFRKDEVKFATKTAMGAVVFAAPAFISVTRPYYVHYRLEWGLLTYMIVVGMTKGATYSAGFYRTLGNAVGAIVAILAWHTFAGHPVGLSLFGVLFSLPCFYLIVYSKNHNTTGRFILLGYNLCALYAYSISRQVDNDDDDDEGGLNPIITTIAGHRLVAVIAGVLWGTFINVYIFPMKARTELRDGISDMWLQMGWVWKSDAVNLTRPQVSSQGFMSSADDQSIDILVHMQKNLLKLRGLLAQAPNEPRLKGPFPTHSYGRLLDITQDMMDAFTALRVAVTKNGLEGGINTIVLETAQERKEVSGAIFLYFYLLASAMRMKIVFPEGFPTAEAARDRLVRKIGKLRAKVKDTEGDALMDENLAPLYAYTLASGKVLDDLERLGAAVIELFGRLDA
ncbi:hypothetical protein SAICODRAFT_56649 [Saitoella complicata NRRL Y-17804]|uniref:uncharacterized protein n=1 Tax=Saitoella complicata (strain BCRC 22490 / CBS 7301 / JCM 7358 / NBRC 10748 / NRRL Y-17804) TaxID=698492 RepID=UPI000867B553|nr:uncharacterized protein SAICODRAFT_56649 [Saitoella complicata NRRL Y-17804]ODQ53190.1 hypothetical protein SAICODRAFT_56649 [Saitoella complicata NRRL Y-17804]